VTIFKGAHAAASTGVVLIKPARRFSRSR